MCEFGILETRRRSKMGEDWVLGLGECLGTEANIRIVRVQERRLIEEVRSRWLAGIEFRLVVLLLLEFRRCEDGRSRSRDARRCGVRHYRMMTTRRDTVVATTLRSS